MRKAYGWAFNVLILIWCGTTFAASPMWDMIPFVPETGKLTIMIDTNLLEDGQEVFQAEIEAKFLTDDGTLLAARKFKLLQSGETLVQGKIYQFEVKHTVPNAKRIEAGNMVFTMQFRGSKS